MSSPIRSPWLLVLPCVVSIASWRMDSYLSRCCLIAYHMHAKYEVHKICFVPRNIVSSPCHHRSNITPTPFPLSCLGLSCQRSRSAPGREATVEAASTPSVVGSGASNSFGEFKRGARIWIGVGGGLGLARRDSAGLATTRRCWPCWAWRSHSRGESRGNGA